MVKILLASFLALSLTPIEIFAMQQAPKMCDAACQTDDYERDAEKPSQKARVEECEQKQQSESAWSLVDDFSKCSNGLFFLGNKVYFQIAHLLYKSKIGQLSIRGYLYFNRQPDGVVHLVIQKTQTGFFATWDYFDGAEPNLHFDGYHDIDCECQKDFGALIEHGILHVIAGFLDVYLTEHRNFTNELCPMCKKAVVLPQKEDDSRCYLKCLHILHKQCFNELVKHEKGKVQCPICHEAIEDEDDFLITINNFTSLPNPGPVTNNIIECNGMRIEIV